MKVYISKYKNFYTIDNMLYKIFFWEKRGIEEPAYITKINNFLMYGKYELLNNKREVGEVYDLIEKKRKTTLFFKLFSLLNRFSPDRKIKIKIHDYDIWNMDETLSHIILPMLKKIKEDKHGYAIVDDEDVPKSFSFDESGEEEGAQKWSAVIDEMIFSFSCSHDDKEEDKFFKKTGKFKLKKLENGNSEMISSGVEIDRAGLKAHNERVANGFILFGKYYTNLWT